MTAPSTYVASASADELELLRRTVSEYVAAHGAGVASLLRLTADGDAVDALFAAVESILRDVPGAEAADIEIVSGHLLDVTRPGDRVLGPSAAVAGQLALAGRYPVEGFEPAADTAVDELRRRLGWMHVAWLSVCLRTAAGYGDAARLYLRAMDDAGLEPSAISLPHPAVTRLSLETERLLRRCASRQAPLERTLGVLHVVPGRPDVPFWRSVCRTTFETESIPAAWLPWLGRMHRVWVTSAFNVDAFERGGVSRDALRVLPETIDLERFRPDAAPRELPGRRAFAFLSNFDFQDRKNWQALLRAYVEEFEDDDDVTLVLKVNAFHCTVQQAERRVAGFLDTVPVPERRRPHVLIDASNLPEDQMPGLYTACDAYVSPTRGEGWGRPLMEALACGLPTVASRWSGQLEFLHDGNAWLVDGRVIDVPATVDVSVFRGHRWFDPDHEALCAAMRSVRDDRAGARAKALSARPALVQRFGLPAIAERIAELVLEAAQ